MKLTIKNFRSIEYLKLDIVKGVNFIYSEKNGAGKTNIVYAVLAALFGKIPVNHNLNALRKDEYDFRGNKHFVSLSDSFFAIDTDFNGHYRNQVLTGEKSERREQWFRFLDLQDLQQKELFRLITTKIFITSWAESIANIGNAERSRLLLSLFGVGFIDEVIKRLNTQKLNVVSEHARLQGFVEGANITERPDIKAIEKKIQVLKARVGDLANLDHYQIEEEVKFWRSKVISLEAEINNLGEEDIANDYDGRIEELSSRLEKLKKEYGYDSVYMALDSEPKEELKRLDVEITKLGVEIGSIEDAINNAKTCPKCSARLLFHGKEVEEFDIEEANKKLQLKREEQEQLLGWRESVAGVIECDKLLDEINSLKEKKEFALSAMRDKKETLLAGLTEAKGRLIEYQEKAARLEKHSDDILRLHELESELVHAKRLYELYLDVQGKKARLTELSEELNDYKFLVRTALPQLKFEMINERCLYLQTKINEILEFLGADGRVEFRPKQNKDGEVTEIQLVEYNNGRWADFYSLNTGEQNLLTLAANLAQSDAHPHKLDELGILILDDIFGKLDDDKEERLGEYLHGLGKYVIITSCKRKAVDTIQPDNVITVEKEDGKTVTI